MDRYDLKLALVALEALIQEKAAALDVLAIRSAAELAEIAGILRAKASGFTPVLIAADELDAIAEQGAGALARRKRVELGAAMQVMRKLAAEAPTSRFSRRKEARLEDRRRRRVARSERLQAIAGGDRGADAVTVPIGEETKH